MYVYVNLICVCNFVSHDLTTYIQLLLMLEGTMATMIAGMLKNGVMDFYDELLNLLYLFTCVGVSETMWCLLPIIYEMFQQDGSDFFNG